MADNTAPTLHRLGERALVLVHDGEQSFAIQQRMWDIARDSLTWQGVDEAVPGMNNLTLFLTSHHSDDAGIERRLRAAWSRPLAFAQAPGRNIDIPVRYGSSDGPDLPDVARACGMTQEAVVHLHSSVTYVVYFLGFQPGFAYLAGLDPRLNVARRAEPRTRVPAGSVGVAGEQTGVYPRSTPGGWQLIGRTTISLFDASLSPPSLLRAGDRVRFVVEAHG